MIGFLHTNIPDPIVFNFGFLAIHWYGLLLTLGVIAGFFVARYLGALYGIKKEHIYNLLFHLVIFGLLGGRLYHVFNEPLYYWQNPGQIIAVWNGGLAIHGVIISGLVVLWVYLKKHSENIINDVSKKLNPDSTISFQKVYLILLDVLVPALVIGQAIGRWGNYFNQELYGLPTDAPWGIPIAPGNRMPGYEDFSFFHPTFLYESIANLIVFLLLVYLHKRRVFNLKPRKGISGKFAPGTFFAFYLIAYALIRGSLEFLRIDRTPLIGGIRLPILMSAVLLIVGIVMMWYSYRDKTLHV